MDSNFRAFWLAPVTRNILGYSLFSERREKWRASRLGIYPPLFTSPSGDSCIIVRLTITHALTTKASVNRNFEKYSFCASNSSRRLLHQVCHPYATLRAKLMQWWEYSLSIRVQFPDPPSYVSWVCWFSTLLWKVFPRVLRFSPLTKNQHLILFHLLWFSLIFSLLN